MGIFDVSKESKKKLFEFFEEEIKLEEKLQTVFESTNEGILFLNKNNIITDLNKKMLEMSKYSKKKFIGKKITNLPKLFDPKKIIKVLKNKKPLELILRTKSNKELHTEFTVFLVKREGKLIGKTLIIRDITSKKKLQKLMFEKKEQKTINALRNKFFMRTSHELRTPLTPIIGYANVLKKELKGKNSKYAGKIVKNANQLKNLLNNIIMMTKIEAGDFNINIVKAEIKNLIKEAISEYEDKIHSKKITLLKKYKKMPKSKVDPVLLKQAIINLIDNSVNNTKNGKIIVTLDEDKKNIIIIIEDTGKGINPKMIKKIKKKTAQIYKKDTLKELHKGFGLGLIITNSIIELHKGKLTFKSRKGKKGTKVLIEIPKK